MVDSRKKGYTAEIGARDELRKYTDHVWERIPGSGALKEEHGLKGDLYVPQNNNVFCIEVKHYKDDQLTSKILSGKAPIFFEWWVQAITQAEKVKKCPLLLFKYDRSKWFAAFDKHNVGFTITSTEEIAKTIEVEIKVPEHLRVTVALLPEFVNAVNKHGKWVR
jgi:hypothetical protein